MDSDTEKPVFESKYDILPSVLVFFPRRARLRIFDDGFALSGTMRQSMTARFEEIPAFGCEKISRYVDGTASGLIYDFYFVWPELASKPINYQFVIWPASRLGLWSSENRSADDGLELLLQRLTTGIAGRMADEFDTRGEVHWTQGIFLTQNCIEFRPQNSQEAGRIGYGEIISIDDLDEVLLLKSQTASLSELRIPKMALNFWPGFHVLKLILEC